MIKNDCVKLVVLGGGSAGWLTALFLNKRYPEYNISVIEDPEQPPIIAGESSSSILTRFISYLGIDLDDWIVTVNAMPKLGSEFYDWDGVGTKFTHGLVDNNYSNDWINVNQKNLTGKFWDDIDKDFLLFAISENISLDEIFFCNKLIHNNRLPIVPHQINSTVIYKPVNPLMWHFDSRANAEYLKNVGIKNGIELVEGKYIDSTQDLNGNILSIKLKNNLEVSGDFFFDCSGFARLLTQKKLGVTFKDLTDIFPARSVVAWWDDTPNWINHTRVYAMEYGWSWNINLRHRAGNGYIYDPDLITDDQAIGEAEKRFGKKIDPVAGIKFTPSTISTPWHKNVIAIGISSGFLEPLESNGLTQVISTLQLIERTWCIDPTEYAVKMFNEEYSAQQQEFIDFLSLHYRGHRRDTEFWRSHAYEKNRMTQRLQYILDAWDKGQYPYDKYRVNVYGYESNLQVATGLNLINKDKLKTQLLRIKPNLLKTFYDVYNNYNLDAAYIVNTGITVTEWERKTYVSKI
jgi:tryptophan halogenase